MAREKFSTLTEQMFLLALEQPGCGVDVIEKIRLLTSGRVALGPGTLYALLAEFQKAGHITEINVEGRRRSYQITPKGRTLLEREQRRLCQMTRDYEQVMRGALHE